MSDASEDSPIDTTTALGLLGALEYQSGELENYLSRIAVSVSQLLEIDWSVVTLSETPGFDRILASSKDIGAAADETYPLHGTVTEQVMNKGQPLCVSDTDASPESGSVPKGFRSYIGVPLRISDGRIIGTICSFHGRPRQFTQQHVQVAGLFAERAAAAIERFSAFRKLEEFNEQLEALVEERTRELNQTHSKLVQQERLAAIGEFASMITHEIRSPISTITMALDYVQRDTLSAGARKRIQLAIVECERLQSLLNEILLYAKPHLLRCEQLDLDVLISETIEKVSQLHESEHGRIDYRCVTASTATRGDRDKLRQLFINLISNACQAVSSQQTVSIVLSRSTQQDGLKITVSNPGSIPERNLAKLTEPFFTTKVGGTGLGLAIVKRIVDSHDGELQIRSDSHQGVSVTVTLPSNDG